MKVREVIKLLEREGWRLVQAMVFSHGLAVA